MPVGSGRAFWLAVWLLIACDVARLSAARVLQADQGSMVGQELNVGPLQAGKLMVEAADASKPDGEEESSVMEGHVGHPYGPNFGSQKDEKQDSTKKDDKPASDSKPKQPKKPDHDSSPNSPKDDKPKDDKPKDDHKPDNKPDSGSKPKQPKKPDGDGPHGPAKDDEPKDPAKDGPHKPQEPGNSGKPHDPAKDGAKKPPQPKDGPKKPGSGDKPHDPAKDVPHMPKPHDAPKGGPHGPKQPGSHDKPKRPSRDGPHKPEQPHKDDVTVASVTKQDGPSVLTEKDKSPDNNGKKDDGKKNNGKKHDGKKDESDKYDGDHHDPYDGSKPGDDDHPMPWGPGPHGPHGPHGPGSEGPSEYSVYFPHRRKYQHPGRPTFHEIDQEEIERKKKFIKDGVKPKDDRDPPPQHYPDPGKKQNGRPGRPGHKEEGKAHG